MQIKNWKNTWIITKIAEYISIDSSTYEQIILENEIKVLVVNNPKYIESSIIVDVDAGAINEPDEIPGLAHLCEHAMFMGSKKYPDREEWNKFVNRNSGFYNAATSLERMEFGITINNNCFEQTVDILANSIAEPLLNAEACKKEIEIVEYEYKMRRADPFLKWYTLFQEAFESNKRDVRWFSGNRQSLLIPGIENHIKRYHEDYFTGNRMQIIIASSLPIKDLLRIAKIFKIVRKGKVKREYNHLKHKENAKFNEKYEVESLIQEPSDFTLKKEFASSIVNFKMSTNDKNKLFLVYNLPGLNSKLKNSPFIYFVEMMFGINKDTASKQLIANGLIEKMDIIHEIKVRYTRIYINITLRQTNSITVNKVLGFLQNFFKTHSYDKSIIAGYNNHMRSSYKEITNSHEASMNFLEIMRFTDRFHPKYFTSVPNEPEPIKNFIKELADFNNCTAWLLTKDEELVNSVLHCDSTYGVPEKMNIAFIEQDIAISKKKSSLNVLISKIYNFIKCLFVSDEKRIVFHKQLDNGDYTLISDNKVSRNKATVNITLKGNNSDIITNISNELFMMALFHRVNGIMQTKFSDLSCVFFIVKIYENKAIFTGNARMVIEMVQIFTDLFKSFIPNEFELKNAEISLLQIYENQRAERSLTRAFLECLSIIKEMHLHQFDDSLIIKSAIAPVDYYTVITAVGDIEEEEIEHIYEALRSTGTKQSLEKPIKHDIVRSININNNNEDNGIIYLYHIEEGSRLKKMVLGYFLKVILYNNLWQVMRVDNQVSYAFDLDVVIINENFYFAFLIQTLHDIEVIDEIMTSFIKEYKTYIERISEKELESIKKSAVLAMEKNNIETFECLVFMCQSMRDFGVYDLNLNTILQEGLNLITKEDLLGLELFDKKPLVVEAKVKN